MITLSGTPTLTTDRLRLRGFQPSDAEAFVAYFQSDRAAFTGGPMTAKAAWRHLATNMGHWALRGFGMFAATRHDSDDIIGMFGHWFPHGWAEREVGYVLFNAADEGRGIASEAVRACITHAYDTLGWDTAVSYIDPNNAASIALAERVGGIRDDAAPKPDTTYPVVIYRHPHP
ncbi:GNAT family N-acetyltransferase [uncultured Tateyamaria sp.]|uniref:GNAT family N-acetyltransferase n=1 Tax=Tateyamaria sp. 1078 TaxID=3417464 RepID=UPI002626F5FA|nr:GNAT family N-acetyltransferase [uncultured Tateyamaria sp.]